jgi:hypothetical protein
MHVQALAGLQCLVRVIGGDVLFGSSGTKHSWLLGAISEPVPKSATSIECAHFSFMDAGYTW